MTDTIYPIGFKAKNHLNNVMSVCLFTLSVVIFPQQPTYMKCEMLPNLLILYLAAGRKEKPAWNLRPC